MLKLRSAGMDYIQMKRLSTMIKYIKNEEHYEHVLLSIAEAKTSVWIGTADVKDLHIKFGYGTVPFLQLLDVLVRRGVDVRLLHAKEPGPNFREDFDKLPTLIKGLKRHLCPRVHFKIIIIDGVKAYLGSANLTGAAMEIKSANNRNFEAGLLSDDANFVGFAQTQYLSVWNGDMCARCGRKKFCSDPIK